MKITLTDIGNEYYSHFAHLDPFGLIKKKIPKGFFAIGATVEKDGEDLPVGLMILSAEEGDLTVEWIYATPEYRYQRVGSALLSAAFEEALARRLPNLTARIDSEYLDEKIGWDPQGYLKTCFFKEITPEEEDDAIWMAAPTAKYKLEKEAFLQRQKARGKRNDRTA